MEKALSRRSLVRGSAWAAPIILASATIPSYAASIPRHCGSIIIKPGSEVGKFSLTIPTDLERLSLSILVGKIFMPQEFSSPWWLLSRDRKLLSWQPYIYPQVEPTVTFNFSIGDENGRVLVTIDSTGCPSQVYDSDIPLVVDSE